MLDWWRNRRLRRARPDARALDQVVAAFPVLERLDDDQRQLLYERVTEILADKSFQAAGGLALKPSDVLAVAALAALPILYLGTDWYRQFHTFILYPGEFQAEFEEVDDDGLIHSGVEPRLGEAWAHGPVVLGLEEVKRSGHGEGFNVVVHELAHQIDQLNGDMDGFPPLHEDMDAEQWASIFSQAFERLCEEVDNDLPPSLDPYAAESPAEFFAVASELYFDIPDWLSEHQPDLYQQLAAFYQKNTTNREDAKNTKVE